MIDEKTIGIVAGAGPYAGLDLLSKILNQTVAATDQEHLTIASLSKPSPIPDRTEFLLGMTAVNPAYAIVDQTVLLERMGADVVGIPCNTAHAPPIFDVVLRELRALGSKVRFLHMIEETARHINLRYPLIKKIGVLSTTGTCRAGIYPAVLSTYGYEVLLPDQEMQEEGVHRAIYDPDFGIKACGTALPQASNRLYAAANYLRDAGAQALILGCTEIPLAIREHALNGMTVIDPTLVLGRALISHAAPQKLKPWERLLP